MDANAKARRYYSIHKEKILARQKNYERWKPSREKMIEKGRRWKLSNPEGYKICHQNKKMRRRALEKNCLSTVTPQELKQIKLRRKWHPHASRNNLWKLRNKPLAIAQILVGLRIYD